MGESHPSPKINGITKSDIDINIQQLNVSSNETTDDTEVLFLIANYLKHHTKCQRAATALIEELNEHKLLKENINWKGERKSTSFIDYELRHRYLGSEHLLDILKLSVEKDLNEKKDTPQQLSLFKQNTLHRRIRNSAIQEELSNELVNSILKQLTDLRRITRSIKAVRRLVMKYDRIRPYLDVSNENELPVDIRTEIHALNLSTAPDVRAIKQLLLLRSQWQSQTLALKNSTFEVMRLGILKPTIHAKKNQIPQIMYRELGQRQKGYNSTYVYSRLSLLKILNGHLQIPVYCLTYDKHGEYVVSGADDRLVKIWSLKSGNLQLVLRGHMGNITDLSINSSNTLLASSSEDKTIRIWELSTGAPVALLQGHLSAVNNVHFHPFKNVILSSSEEGRCLCHSLPELGRVTTRETKHETALRLVNMNLYLLSVQPVLSLSHGRLGVRSSKITSLTFSRCGNYVVTGGQDGMGRIWDISSIWRTGTNEVDINEPDSIDNQVGPDNVFNIPPSDNPLAHSRNGSAQSHDFNQRTNVQTANQPQIPFEDVNQTPSLQIDPIALLKGHTNAITNISYNAKGDSIVTASIKDGTARIWRWSANYKSIKQIILLAPHHKEEQDRRIILSMNPQNPYHLKPLELPAVDTISWTHDDKRIITLHSLDPQQHSEDWQQRIRIWNPLTGDLMLTLAATDPDKTFGHKNVVFVLDTHPTDWRIILTAGYDGRIFIWDISNGTMLKSFTNISPENEEVSILDGGFLPNGEGFCCTDRIGRLLLFGTGSGSQYAAAPSQQYFQSDYVPLIEDQQRNVVDRDQQVHPSLLESGPLVDALLEQYVHQPPHLLNIPLTPKKYEANRICRVNQAATCEIKCGIKYQSYQLTPVEKFPSAVYKDEQKENLSNNLALITAYRLNGGVVLQSELNGIQRNRPRIRRTRRSPRADERDTSILNMEISSEDDPGDEDFQETADEVADADGDEDDDEDEDEDELLSDDDLRIYSSQDSELSAHNISQRSSRFRRRSRDRQTTESQNDDMVRVAGRSRLRQRRNASTLNEDEIHISRSRRSSRRGLHGDQTENNNYNTRLERNLTPFIPTTHLTASNGLHIHDQVEDNQELHNVETNDGGVLNDNQVDRFDTSVTYTDILKNRVEQAGLSIDIEEHRDEIASLIVCAFCGEGDVEGPLKLPGEICQHPLISGAQRLFVHDKCATFSPRCFFRNGKWYNIMREIRRGRGIKCVECKRKGATIGCGVDTCQKSWHWKCAISCGWTTNEVHFYCRQHRLSSSELDDANGSSSNLDDEEEPMGKRFGKRFNRDWLQQLDISLSHQYIPQVGDYVIYFPYGHQLYNRSCQVEDQPYIEKFSSFFGLKCKILDVRYVFPRSNEFDVCSTIKCDIKLAALAAPVNAFPNLPIQNDQNAQSFSTFCSIDSELTPTVDGIRTERYCFNLLFHPNDTANFIVLDHEYENGVGRQWQISERVQMPFCQLNRDGMETGFTTGIGNILEVNCHRDVPVGLITPWESVYVQWDGDDGNLWVSPWELEPANHNNFVEKRSRDERRFSTRLFRLRNIRTDVRNTLAQEFRTISELSIAEDFVQPVDEDMFVDYSVTIANPMNLNTILLRLENNYYRQVEALISDIHLISLNCERYNVHSSTIAQNARNVCSQMLIHVQRQMPSINTSTRLLNPESNGSNLEPNESNVLVYPPDDIIENFDHNEESDFVSQTFSDRHNDIENPTTTCNPNLEDVANENIDNNRESLSEAVELDNNIEPLSRNTEDEERVTSKRVTRTKSRKNSNNVSHIVHAVRPQRKPKVLQPENRRLVQYAALLETLSSPQLEEFNDKVSEDLTTLLVNFHEALVAADKEFIFTQPVTEDVAPGYFSVIHQPMDFGTMMDNIDKYQSFEEYYDDVYLVFSNAITYNGWDSEIGGWVQDLTSYCRKFILDAIGASNQARFNGKQKRQRISRGAVQRGTTHKIKISPNLKRSQRQRSNSSSDEASWESSKSSSSADSESSDGDVMSEESDEPPRMIKNRSMSQSHRTLKRKRN